MLGSGTSSRKKVPKKAVSKEALRVTAQKKKESTVKAMAIIERMIEEKVEEKWLLDSVHSITEDQYQDITEERAITELCGYPLCCKSLKNIPSKMYHISTRQNKVYDITERKNFCSSGCYKASIFLKNQLLSSPLWLRDAEDRPDYKILHVNEGGSLGAEIDLGHSRVRLSDINLPGNVTTTEEVNEILSENLARNEAGALDEHEKLSEDLTVEAKGTLRTECNENELKEDSKSEKEEILESIIKKELHGSKNTISVNSKSSSQIYQSKVSESICEPQRVSERIDESKSVKSSFGNSGKTKLVQTDNLSMLDNPLPSKGSGSRNDSVILPYSTSDEGSTKKLVLQKSSCPENLEEEHLSALSRNEGAPGSIDSSETNLVKKCSVIPKKFSKNVALEEENLQNPIVVKSMPSNDKTTSNTLESKSSRGSDRSKPSTTESNSKERSVFKKERHKTKNPEENVDRKKILLNVVKHIEKCLQEWMTFDSLVFLLGEEAVKNMLRSKGANFKDCQNLCGTDASTYETYLSICKKLNMLELEDARGDAAVKEKNAELKPLPDYSLLQREAKQLEIKVRSFYEGSTRIEIADELPKSNKEDDEGVVLPLVDLHAQKALRRRIVLDRLNVILPDLGRTLNLSVFNLTSAVRNLSQTFNFSSCNITFKPPEWYFIAMVLVKLLSLQDKNMQILLESGSSEKYLTLLLMNWGLDAGYLERLVSWLIDIDYLLQRAS